jgi:hypothetical protein
MGSTIDTRIGTGAWPNSPQDIQPFQVSCDSVRIQVNLTLLQNNPKVVGRLWDNGTDTSNENPSNRSILEVSDLEH